MPVDDSPVCSVCIANYNGMAVIDDCLRSVKSQVCEFSFEIIVHDDASNDGSVEHIRVNHPDVMLMENKVNAGYCISNNRMAARARGRYILLLNNDAALFPDALATLFKQAEQGERTGILGLSQFDWDSGQLIDRGCMLDPFLNAVPNLDAERTSVGVVAGACLWIRKDLWDRIGGFPEWYESLAEDLYLCCRARLAGHPVRVMHGSGFRHHVGRSFGGGKLNGGGLVTTFRRRAMTERNKTYTMVLCYPTAAFVLVFPVHLLLLCMEGLLLACIRRDMRFWKEIYGFSLKSVLGKFGCLWKMRRQIQALNQPDSRFFSVFTIVPYKLAMLIKAGLPRVD